MRKNQQYYRQFLSKIRYITQEFPFTDGEVICLRNEIGQIHSLDGFAIRTRNFVASYINGLRHGVYADKSGTLLYYYKSILVPRLYILDAKSLSLDDILSEKNVEIRRIGCEIYGFDRMMREGKFEILDEDEFGNILLSRQIGKGNEELVNMKIVKVIDSTSGKEAFLQVPPEMKRVRQAIAWTFMKTEEEYHPDVET